ncbi:2-dehydro-3-deoxyglucarate aldolase [Aeromicrobium sp. CFBP 8757]|uniref:HpcH/HpaI aldolase family protein n=1 Tax=Aeromicrobium sp. CFBP 8757 TaxID=2775288 RepID=UPI00177FFD58|nr:aldolase/citrate lyase family protein [Aeromicrobium sp. CFBP 8757]MBD8605405.1 2-dehydro-3-deoxyglucarate aldolase [Aeromicrobium sp. CFBP 8757]
MSLRVDLAPTFGDHLAASDRPLFGMWVCSGSPLVAEICAGAGLDWLLIDAEHSPNGLESVLAQLQAVQAYPVSTLVRPPVNDVTVIKQYLDLGAQNLLIPMVDTAEQAAAAVSAVRYPPAGVRGVGSALARSARWNRVPDYLATASSTITLTVQVESVAAVENARGIAETEGVDAIFVGPSDLAASMGLLGQQEHPDVVAAVVGVIEIANATGTSVGVNAFDERVARRYLEAGAEFVLVGADVGLLARGSERLAATYVPPAGSGPEGPTASY